MVPGLVDPHEIIELVSDGGRREPRFADVALGLQERQLLLAPFNAGAGGELRQMLAKPLDVLGAKRGQAEEVVEVHTTELPIDMGATPSVWGRRTGPTVDKGRRATPAKPRSPTRSSVRATTRGRRAG